MLLLSDYTDGETALAFCNLLKVAYKSGIAGIQMQEIWPPYSCPELTLLCYFLFSLWSVSPAFCVELFWLNCIWCWWFSSEKRWLGSLLEIILDVAFLSLGHSGHNVPQFRICVGVNPRSSLPFGTEVCRLSYASESLGSLIKIQIEGTHPQSFWHSKYGVELENLHF